MAAGVLLVVVAAAMVAGDLAILAVGLVFGVAFVIVTLARPETTALGLIVALPFMIYPATIGGFSLFVAIPLFGFVSVILLLRERGAAMRVARSLPARTFAFVCVAALVMSGLSSDPAVAFSRTAYLILFGLFTAALATALAGRRITVDALVRAVVISGVIAGIAVIVQFAAQFAVGRGSTLSWLQDVRTLFGGENAGSRNWQITDPDVLRGIVPFMTPPSAGQYLMLCLIAAVWWRRGEGRMRVGGANTPETIAVVLIGLALLFTFSRQSWVGALAGLVALVLIHRPVWLLGMGLAVVAISLVPAPGSQGTFGDYLRSASDTSTRSTSGRIDLWERSIEEIPSHAAVGTGPGLYDTLTRDATGVTYAHNVYLDAAIELGLAGAVALVAALAIALRAAIRRRQQLAFALIVAFMAASMFDDVLYFPRNGLLLAIAFALLAAPPQSPPTADPEPRGYRSRRDPASPAPARVAAPVAHAASTNPRLGRA